MGYFTDATVASGIDGLFVPVTPARMLDTRPLSKPLAGTHTTLSPLGRDSVPATEVAAVFANVTATQAEAGWVQALPGASEASEVGRYSTVNVDHADQTIPNATLAGIGTNGTVDLYTSATAHLLVDVAGYFTSSPPPPSPLSIQMASPTGTVSGNQLVTASTTGDDILGVQFRLNGVNLGAEDTTTPYSTTWVTAYVRNDDYELTAVVRRADETLTSAVRTVHVSNAIVTLTFDDGWDSHLPAAQLLADAGLPATFFIMSDFLSYPYLTVEQLTQLKAMGHEIGSHTVDHKNLTTLTTEESLAELTDSKTVLTSAGLGPITNFASPYGEINEAVRAQIATLYGSHRSIGYNLNYPADRRNFEIDPGYTGFDFDRYNLQVRNIFGSDNPELWHSTTTPETMQGWLDELRQMQTVAHTDEFRNNAWMILVFHEVSDTPHAGLPEDPPEVRNEYNVRPAVFAQFIDQFKTSGVRVLTMQQALVETTTITG